MTPDEKRRAYNALPSDTKKELAEMGAFIGFAQAANLAVESPTNEKPPLPDISCKIGGSPYLFELGEITDEGVAENVSKSLRTGEVTGGAFSEEEPLIRIIRKKAASTYRTDGAPLDLLLHYDKQYPFAPGDYLKRYEADIAAAMIPNGPFSRIWIYDSWTKSILWSQV
jgi:hypothetical protein